MSKHKITQAMILGAGLGTRLRPITDTIPKVMVPIATGKPLLAHTIEWMREQGVNRFIINIHYLPEVITSYFGDGRKWGVNITYSDETKQLLDTGGAIKKAQPLLDDQFFFLYGDELNFFNYSNFGEEHIKQGGIGSIVLKEEIPQDGEVAKFDRASKKIVQWHTRPHHIAQLDDSLLVNAGIYAFSKKILDYIPPAAPIKLDGEVIPRAFADGAVFYAFPTTEPILDIGKPEKYERAMEYYEKKIRKSVADPWGTISI
jgi:NDP-sugar pyrophosphorylase family protein